MLKQAQTREILSGYLRNELQHSNQQSGLLTDQAHTATISSDTSVDALNKMSDQLYLFEIIQERESLPSEAPDGGESARKDQQVASTQPYSARNSEGELDEPAKPVKVRQKNTAFLALYHSVNDTAAAPQQPKQDPSSRQVVDVESGQIVRGSADFPPASEANKSVAVDAARQA